jgi:hypothetical protein
MACPDKSVWWCVWLVSVASVLCLGACALNFNTDPVDRPEDVGTDPDAVDVGPESDAPDVVGDADGPDVVDEDVAEDLVEEELFDPYAPIVHVSEDLLAFVSGLPIISDPSSFTEPGATRRSSWVGLLNHLMIGEYPDALDEAGFLGLELRVVDDTVSGRPFLVLWDTSRAEGIYVFDPEYVNPLVVQVPYPVREAGTLGEGVEVLRQAQGWALLVSGAGRCLMTDTVTCDGTTTACSMAAEPYRISDVAHNPDLIFHLVHRLLADRDSSSIIVQLQGQSDSSGALAILSDGTSIEDVASASVGLRNSLSDSLRPDHPTYADSIRSCNNAADAGLYTSGCNMTNVQGRWTNGVTDPCNTAATAASGRFVVMELDADLRDSAVYEEVAAAVATLFD